MQRLDPNSLTREELIRYLEVSQELKKRQREKAAVYTPNEGQTPVHKSEAMVRCVFSGNGAGKTAMSANEVLWAAKGFNPITGKFLKVPARIIVLLDHPEKVTDVWLPELMKWANLKPEQLWKRGKPYVSRISFDNGSEILFMFHQQEPMLFESIELDYLIADEPPPRHVYISLRRGGRKKNRKARYLIVGTPITGSWLRQEIYDPWVKKELQDTDCFRFGTIVNEANLGEDYINDFSRILSEKEKRIRLHGEFFDLDGLALSYLFDQRMHVIPDFKWPTDWPVVFAVDVHSSKPHHALMLGVNEDNEFVVIKELKRKVVARDFAQELKKWYRGYKVVDMICDSLGSSESTGGEGFKSFIQILNEEGVRIRSTTWDDKKDEDFIDRIKSVLAIPDKENNFGQYTPMLRIFQSCRGIISDIENVQWTKYRNTDEFKPKLDITNKDYLSCLKYALASNLVYGKEKVKMYRWKNKPTTYGITDRRTKKVYRMKFGMRRK